MEDNLFNWTLEWESQLDRYLLRLKHLKYTLQMMAGKLGCTEDEITARLVHLSNNAPPATLQKVEAEAKQEQAAPPPFLQTLMAVSQAYNALGEGLQATASFINSMPSDEDLVKELTSAWAAYEETYKVEMEKGGMVLKRKPEYFLARYVINHFLLIPKGGNKKEEQPNVTA